MDAANETGRWLFPVAFSVGAQSSAVPERRRARQKAGRTGQSLEGQKSMQARAQD